MRVCTIEGKSGRIKAAEGACTYRRLESAEREMDGGRKRVRWRRDDVAALECKTPAAATAANPMPSQWGDDIYEALLVRWCAGAWWGSTWRALVVFFLWGGIVRFFPTLLHRAGSSEKKRIK